ncbi:MAG: hypothetical protein ACREJ1_10645, partial [Candidatus Methylomirabilales bacterium]
MIGFIPNELNKPNKLVSEGIVRHGKTIERGEVRREVLRLALPVTVSNLLHRMVTAVDIFLVGGLGAP